MTSDCCNGETQKFGQFKNVNGIVQRFRCLTCNKTFSKKQPLDGIRIDNDKAAQVVQMLCEGIGIRAVSRLTGLDQGTVLRVLETAGAKAAAFLDAKVKNVAVKHVAIDELFGFVECLQQNTEVTDMLRGDQYAFLSIEQDTKFILNWHVGKRDKDAAMTFLGDLKARVAGRFQLTSDGFAAYAGHTGGVRTVFGDTIDYGFEVKHFATEQRMAKGTVSRRNNPVKCMWVKRVPQIGNPDRARMTTNHAERNNLSVRLFNRRFTRKTLGYSKKLANHKHSVTLHVAHFNFCRVHSSLKVEATATTPAQQRTPAMAQGLTDHVWTVRELLIENN